MHTTLRGPQRAALAGLSLILAVALALSGSGLQPAAAAPLPGVEELPRILIVARNDIPADALSAGPVAGALGGVILITPTGTLSQPAHDALVAYAPDRVYVAGGAAAISDATAQAIDDAGPWDVVRKSGPSRDHTAAALATILTDHGVTRPAVAGNPQIIGDVRIGGLLHTDTLAVESSTHVPNLNADLLDDLDSTAFLPADAADDFLPADSRGLAVAGARVSGANGHVGQWFNRAGGELISTKLGTGIYDIEVPGFDLTASNYIPTMTVAQSSPAYATAYSVGTKLRVRIFDANGALVDQNFFLTLLDASGEG